MWNLQIKKLDASFTPARPAAYLKDENNNFMIGAFFRIHPTKASSYAAAGSPTCQADSDTGQIGCLVNADPCSIGYAGREADQQTGNSALFVNGVRPTDQAVAKLMTDTANAYPLSRRLYFASLVGFDNVTGGELELAKCMTNNTAINKAMVDHNFVTMSTTDATAAGGSPATPGGVQCLNPGAGNGIAHCTGAGCTPVKDVPLAGCTAGVVQTNCSTVPATLHGRRNTVTRQLLLLTSALPARVGGAFFYARRSPGIRHQSVTKSRRLRREDRRKLRPHLGRRLWITRRTFGLASSLLVITLTSLSGRAFADVELPREDPWAKVAQQVGLTEISISYITPAAKGRKVWGSLVPYGQPWWIGASSPPTKITFSQDVMLGDRVVPAGSYALLTIPTKSAWTLILNKSGDNKPGDDPRYRPERDVVRVHAAVKSAPHRERLTFLFTDVTDDKASLDVEWDNARVSFPIRTQTQQQVHSRPSTILDRTWRAYQNAALYMLQTKKDYDAGLKYIEQSLALKEDWYSLWIKAALFASKKEYKDAREQAEEGLGAFAQDSGDLGPGA